MYAATSFGSGHAAGSPWRGLRSALRAIRSAGRMDVTQRYFRAVSQLPFRLAATRRVVNCMSRGSVWGVVQAGWVCARNYRLLFPTGPAWRRRVTAFFTPFYFVRDSSAFVIK